MQVTGASSYSYLQQMQQMQQTLFSKADTNGDGSLSIDEFEAAGKSDSAGSANSADQSKAAALFKTIDTNGDGQVSQSELGSYFTKLSSNSQSQLLQFQQQLFDKADTNGDGSLSLAEFEGQSAGSTQSASDSKAADLFNKIDSNGDGKVTQDELTSYMSANKPQGVGGAHGGHRHAHGAGGGSKSLADLLGASDTDSTSDSDTDTTTAITDLLTQNSTDSTTSAADSSGTGTSADFGKQIAAYLQQMLSGYADQTQNSTSGINLVA
jgi:Ca2+-binding EF-hand superfamily protein